MGESGLVKGRLSKAFTLGSLNSDPFLDAAQMRRCIETDLFERSGCFVGSIVLASQILRQNREDKGCRGSFAFGAGDMDSIQRVEFSGLARGPCINIFHSEIRAIQVSPDIQSPCTSLASAL